MEMVQVELVNLLMAIVVACFGLITQKVTSYMKQKGVIAKLEANKNMVKIVVDAVEQMYGEIDGNGKLEIAKSELVRVMKEKGIKIGENEINLLIESVIKEMNDKIKENK